MLQTRTRVLDSTVRMKFQSWYPKALQQWQRISRTGQDRGL